MATITASTVNGYVEEAIVLMAAGSYAEAKIKLLAAQAGLSIIPDGRQGESEMKFDRRAIQELLTNIDKAYASTTGLQFTKIQPGITSDAE